MTKASDALSAAQRARDAERQTQDLKVSEAQTERDAAAAATQAALPAYNEAKSRYDTMMTVSYTHLRLATGCSPRAIPFSSEMPTSARFAMTP